MVGFAAETENLIENAKAKRQKKGSDWILANDVSASAGTFGGETNKVYLVDGSGVENWPPLSKRDLADRLARRIADFLSTKDAAE